MVSTRIYIPTRGRVGLNRQVTLREFQRYSTWNPVLVCPPDEVHFHKEYGSLVLGCPVEGIGPTRQWILENADADIVCMVSDDLRFYYRPDPAKVQLERCRDLDPLMSFIEECVADGFVHGGVGARLGNQNKSVNGERFRGIVHDGHCTVDCERVNDFHWLHRGSVLRLGARFDLVRVMEDFHFTLSLLTKGVPNRVIHDYVWNQEGSGLDGGCSLYRTPDVQAESAHQLALAFPEWVRVVTRKSADTSQMWRGLKERQDVVVRWWQAYKAVRKRLNTRWLSKDDGCRRMDDRGQYAFGDDIPPLTAVQRREEFGLC